jgi:hypothetical protein
VHQAFFGGSRPAPQLMQDRYIGWSCRSARFLPEGISLFQAVCLAVFRGAIMKTNPLRILIVEDDCGFSDLLTSIARQQGHCVVAALGAASVEPFIGLGRDGKEFDIACADFDLALCDAELKRARPDAEKFCGSHFVERLAAAGVVCHAMSSIPVYNDKMVELGARSGAMKPFMLFALRDGVVTFQQLFSQPEHAAARIAEFSSEQMADQESFQARLSALCDATAPAR